MLDPIRWAEGRDDLNQQYCCNAAVAGQECWSFQKHRKCGLRLCPNSDSPLIELFADPLDMPFFREALLCLLFLRHDTIDV